jgi:hypothetical protein
MSHSMPRELSEFRWSEPLDVRAFDATDDENDDDNDTHHSQWPPYMRTSRRI